MDVTYTGTFAAIIDGTGNKDTGRYMHWALYLFLEESWKGTKSSTRIFEELLNNLHQEES